MFLIDFFFSGPGKRQLQSKYVLKVAPIRWLSRKGDGGRRGDLFVFLIQVLPACRAQAANRRRHDFNFAYNVAGMQRVPSVRPSAARCSKVLSCGSWLQGGKARVSKSRPADQKVFFIIMYFCRLLDSQKQCVLVALEEKPLLL